MLLVTIVALAPTIAIPFIRHLDFTALPEKPGFIAGIPSLVYAIVLLFIISKDKKKFERGVGDISGRVSLVPRLGRKVTIGLALALSVGWLGATAATIGLWVVARGRPSEGEASFEIKRTLTIIEVLANFGEAILFLVLGLTMIKYRREVRILKDDDEVGPLILLY